MTRKTWIVALISAGLLLAVSSAAFNIYPPHWFSKGSSVAPTNDPATVVTTSNVATSSITGGVTPNWRAIVQQVGPAVVGVTVAGLHKAGPDEVPLDLNAPFFRFFRGLPGFQQLPGSGQGGNIPFRSQGFIISSDGLILTNAHVVREAKEVIIKLSDRREFKAKVLGADTSTDIAVLRVDVKNLPVVRLGDSQQLQVGDAVLAIGSPFGFEQSVTQGIASAKGRALPGGNSGGPLFDSSGALVSMVVEEVAGAAARANLMPGDVLLAINGVALTSVKQVKAVLDKKPKFVALLVLREGERISVPVELG